MATLYIIIVQVTYDYGYNRCIKDSERVFKVEFTGMFDDGKYTDCISRPLGEKIISSIPSVETGGEASIYYSEDVKVSVDTSGSRKDMTAIVTSVSGKAPGMFGFEAESGLLSDFAKPDNVLVSSNAAKRLGVKPGDRIEVAGGSVTVCAVFRDFPANCDLYGIDIFENIGKDYLEDTREWSFPYYVKLRSQDDVAAAEKLMQPFLIESSDKLTDDEIAQIKKKYKLRLSPVSKTYFDRNTAGSGRRGNVNTTRTLLGIAFLVFLIAFINFFNFFFSLVPARMRSVNTYKILGSTRSELIRKFFVEALCFVGIALLLAWGITAEFGRTALGGYISVSPAIPEHPLVAAGVVVLAVLMALVSVIYPARYITSFPPAFAIKGSFSATPAGKTLRYALVGMQFVISIALIIGVLLMNRQYRFLNDHDMGFNRENLLSVSLGSLDSASRVSIENRIRQNPRVKDVTWASGSMVSPGRMGWGRMFKGKDIHYECYVVSHNFLNFFGIPIEEGRDFNADDDKKGNGTYIFNETARKKFGLTLEDKLSGHKDEPADIAGFCRDFNFKPLQYAGGPLCLYVFGKDPWWGIGYMYVRTVPGAGFKDMSTFIRKCVGEMFPETDLSRVKIRTFGDELAARYRSEKRILSLISIFTCISILLSLMGVFSQVMFETQYRIKEIGLRRINGASVKQILGMFAKRYFVIVTVCFVIACPIAYLLVEKWLHAFAYHISPGWPAFLASYALVLAVTLCIVVLRSMRAATENPVNCIRTE